MGARFLAVALTASTAWYGWCWYSSRLSIGGAFLRIMMWAFIAACVGKIVGIVEFRLRSRRWRVKPISARFPRQRALKVFR
jgi:hypothetical protein